MARFWSFIPLSQEETKLIEDYMAEKGCTCHPLAKIRKDGAVLRHSPFCELESPFRND